MGHHPATFWFTGLSGSGKSTISLAFEKALIERGIKAFVLDGDNIRHGLNRDLGFSAEDRKENIRRISEVARLMNKAGIVVITAFISPTIADRASARKIITESGQNSYFNEVFINTPLEVCEQRDPKGLYQKARAGEIQNFTGISAPYEAPISPEIDLPTSELTIEQSVEKLLRSLSL
ncbi:MAG: adenylyl-sulfate kinase [Lentisphaeria bacterium]|nr:adenylyl-sulfate kinase [Lentisphaeria bacterium]